MEIAINGLTEHQKKIADFLWNFPPSYDEINRRCAQDVDFRIVRDMIVAATLDQFDETHLAKKVLQKYNK